MDSESRVRTGISSGLIAGVALAGLFLVLDLGRLAPLATPVNLSASFLGPGRFSIDTPVFSELVAIVVFISNLLVFTLLHFLAFAALGVGSCFACDKFGVPLNVFTGAVYGLLVCSLVFYLSLLVGVHGARAITGLPGPLTVLLASAFAGAVIGGCAQLRRSSS
jgi:hypothetical protein